METAAVVKGVEMNNLLGVIDWGIGGLGLASHLKKIGNRPILYFSDNGHSPFGKTPSSVLNRIFNFLRSQGAGRIAIACNAAHAVYPDTDDITGVITHAVSKLQKGQWKNVGLLAGRSTVYSQVFPKRLTPMRFKLRQRIAQPLSAHIEAGRLSGDALHEDLRKIMPPIKNCDAIALACTHYPAIASQISKYIDDDCELIDPAREMAEWISKTWPDSGGDDGDRWFTTGDISRFAESGRAAFGVDIQDVEQLGVDSI